MSVARSLLLKASRNSWLRERATRYPFVRRTASRFMPGETLDDALAAAQILRNKQIDTIFTHLGENVQDRSEAGQVTLHYLEVLERIHKSNLPAAISVKLTQLGLDLSPEFCFDNLKRIVECERPQTTVWIDMESSEYVDATLDIYRRILQSHPNVGICLQAYLFRTQKDLEALLPLRPAIRLVKGAYNEPPRVAFPLKSDVDNNYFLLAQSMLHARSRRLCRIPAFGTHDVPLIRRITDFALRVGLAENDVEIQMLFGIQRSEQERLARDGFRSVVLVAYGEFWFPWFVRRLAERPANLWFMLRNVVSS
ncbi:MAG: proline dehydrogenase [Candidatus Acidiferrum sp.]